MRDPAAIIDAITMARHALYSLGGMELSFTSHRMVSVTQDASERAKAYNILAEEQARLVELHR